MNTKFKRLLASLLAALLLPGLTACGEERAARKVNWITAPAYEAEDVPLPVQTGDLLGCCTDGEYIYYLIDEKPEEEAISRLCRVSLTDGTAEVLDGFQASDVPDNGYKNTLGPILSPDGMLWLYEMWSIIYYDLPEDFDPEKEAIGQYYTGREDFHHLRQLDPATGRQKKLIDLSDAVRTLDVADLFNVAGFAVDGDGNICFAGTGGVAVLDGKGNYLFTLEADLPFTSINGTSGSTLALLPDGTAALLTVQPGGKREVRTIDANAGTWGTDRYELPSGVDLIYNGSNGFLFYYVNGGALCAWVPEAEESRLLLNWSAADLPGSLMCFAPLDEGRLAALTLSRTGAAGSDGYWYNADIRLSMLSPTDKPPEESRTKLVYGSIGTSSVLRSRINQFNSANDQYYIELRNYAGEGVEMWDLDSAAREAAKKLLSAEVASGRAPDIWDASLPVELYARKGLLEDLWPYIDSDPEISRDTVMSHVLDCASIDGKLYRVFNTFTIHTAAARLELVGERTSWTLKEMMDYYEDMPEGSSIFGYRSGGPSDTLWNLLTYNIDDWIDWTTGECRFDTEEFKALLEVCGSLEDDTGTEIDKEKWNNLANGTDIRAGRQLLTDIYLCGPEGLLIYDAMMAGPQCLMDYEAYLNENNIFAARIDENGNWRDDSVLTCQALSQAAYDRENGKLMNWYPLSPDAAFGAVEGGGYAAYVGIPASSGTGSRFNLPDGYTANMVGISASCQAKEGAWAYARQYLLPGSAGPVTVDGVSYSSLGFPINKEDFERLIEPQWFQREDGEYVLDQDGSRIENPQDLVWVPYNYIDTEVTMVLFQLAPNEIQMERFWDLYNAIGGVESRDSEIMNIIREQAEAYFAGDKSLDETADLIQRRVSLYVNENR